MSLIALKDKGLLALPTEVREQLSLSEGDLLEVTLEGGKIILTPRATIDRAAAFAKLQAVSEQAEKHWRAEGKTDADVEQLILEAVTEVRYTKKAS